MRSEARQRFLHPQRIGSICSRPAACRSMGSHSFIIICEQVSRPGVQLLYPFGILHRFVGVLHESNIERVRQHNMIRMGAILLGYYGATASLTKFSSDLFRCSEACVSWDRRVQVFVLSIV